MTAGGGNLIGSEVNRNKRSAQWAAASIEIADMEQPPALVCSLPALSGNNNINLKPLRNKGNKHFYIIPPPSLPDIDNN